ncbi:unnamed protein product [Adineta steineri]|uniref:TIR domain-containing protein n=2 Tax=Adineta steineri TaxID=433720 RepID=A0A814V5G2_9BILA|nr:unnamed protein product [Adineta steineri]CAF3779179.1 unnamed protein product [Adineta steineri]
MNHNQANFLYSLKPLTSVQLPDNSQIITTCEIKEIYDKIIQLQTKITNNVSQWDTTERQEFWLSIMDIWIELTKQSAAITYNNLYLLTDCFNRISAIWQQCVESKSIIDINDDYTIEKAFSSCLMMLDISHIHSFLYKIDEISNETIVPFNVHLILSVASYFARYLSSDHSWIFNDRMGVLVALINYVEQRIKLIKTLSGSIVECIINLFWNLSDRIFLVPILVEINLPMNIVNWLSYSYEHCVSFISIIHNLSRHDEGVDALNKCNTIEIIKNYQHEKSFMINMERLLLISMILAQLSSPEQLKCDKRIMNGVLNELLQRTMNAAKNESFSDDTGFHISEFLAVMVKLFVVEERTLDYILCHAETEPSSDLSSVIQLFTSLLMSFNDALNKQNQLEQLTLIIIVNILWSISFQTQYLQELIINNKEALLIIESLAENNNNKEIINQYKPRSIESIHVAARGIIHNIQKYSESHTVLNHIQNEITNKQSIKSVKPSVMISYSHDNKIFCDKLVDFLSSKQNVFDIWIDHMNCQTASDLWESIAIGIEKANVIVCLISSYYFESKSCRQEFVYATDTLHKLIVPVILEKFKPKGWLGIRIPGIKYVRFQNIEELDQLKLMDLFDTIQATLSLTMSSIDNSYTLQQKEYYEPTASYLHTVPTSNHRLRINQWLLAAKDDIEAWFSYYHISTHLCDLYDFQTGQEMLLYGKQLIQNYEKHLDIYSKAFIKKYNGDELLPHEFQRFTEAIKELLENNMTSVVSS